ncbi:MAG: amidohydrolase family protein [Deinococcota bacterium]
MLRVDAHQHYWQLARGDYFWMTPDMGVIYRDYQPNDLEPHLTRHNIAKTVVVQAADTVAETEYLLELADAHSSIAGVVGWLDMESPKFEADLLRLREHPKFVGIRPMIQDIDDPAWMLSSKVRESFEALVEHDCAFDFLTHPRHLKCTLEVIRNTPGLRCVIDHISKPYIEKGILQPWQDDLAAIAEFSNVYCKFSGLVTEANHNAWTLDDLRPYAEHVVDCFGTERLMFGSDWPVCLLAASYDQVIESAEVLLADYLDVFDDEARAAVFGGNAIHFYQLAVDG